MAEAAGSFVTRSFERMLKDSGGRKHANFQKALKVYLDRSAISSEASSPSAPKMHPEQSAIHGDGMSIEASNLEAEKPSMDMAGIKSSMSDQHHSSSNTGLAAAATLSKAGHALEGSEAELVLLPLRLAFETKQPKIVETALDCLHKLISYEHLEGDAGWEGGKNAAMLTEMFNLVCASAEHNSPDSTILQVMKVLLTAIASNKFRVHGECLLRSIRVCYNIVLTSKSSVNQATARGTLTQMISIVFKRMESEKKEQEMKKDGKQTSHAENLDSSGMDVVDNKLGDDEVAAATKNDAVNHSQETLEPDLAQVLRPVSVEELQHLAGDADIKGLEAALVKAVHPEGGEKAPEGLDLESMTLSQRDALLVFRTLCKMSMKEESDDVANRTKILSLELLQGLLENVNHSFTVDFHFIDSVKAYLCYTLLRACVSSTGSIFQLAASIFYILLLRFRESLKGEIGVFFPLIVLRSLDSSDSHLHQRMAVLRMLEKACKDPQMIADVFVNYDCDLEAVNLFERMVNSLSRMAQGTLSSDPSNITLAQNVSVKASALQCLVNVLKSLVDWAASHEGTNQLVGVSATFSEGEVVVRQSEDNNLRSNYVEEKIQAEQFEKAKAHKSTLEAAVSEFNRKPEKGIEYLVASKLVDHEPASIAQFLLSTPGLDKGMIGEYLGQHEEFPLAVMHAYVNAISFEGMKFDIAIREFLKGFRLPGEAQKIDRIMEKFAERYCHDNPGLFRSADAAYVLAYAVIMLNTDAHNPMVWPKMSKADFIRINSGSETEEGAPRELLEEIYDSIVRDEIKLKDEGHLLGKGTWQKQDSEERSRLVRILNLGLPRRKVSVDTKKESEDVVKQTRALFKRRGVKKVVFHKAKQMELVKPMLEAVGWPLLAAFSVTMEDTDNKTQVLLCMEGFQLGIHLTKVLCMDTMRYAFLTSLVRFTFLHAPKEMRSKNVEALRTLLGLSETEPDALQDTWNAVLECISRLEHISGNSSIAMTLMQGSNQISREALLQSLTELTGKPTEQVFVNSVKLPSDAIVEFFTALCGVSSEELKQIPPRVYSLQKLVEISYYNMSRIRMVWGRIWLVLAQHFVSAGSHHDEQIAMYAIDSLRQLGIKYLERAELANFTFQNDILKPFVVIIRNSQSVRIHGLIVDCIIQMIKSKVGSIKSGWRSVFMVFKAAALDNTESIVELSFENMEQVVLEHFDQVVGDCFMDCVHCLIAFANNKSFPRISLKSIALLRICEDRLAEGLIPGGASKPIQINDDGAEEVAEHYWFPMLVGLSDLTCDPRQEVRDCALEVLFDLLKERGHKFSPSFWENVFRDVLFPIFDHVRNAGKDSDQSDNAETWLQQTCIHSLQLLCNLFSTFYKEVSFILPSLLGLLLDCATRTDQRVAFISTNALMHLTEVGGYQFNESDWSTLLDSIRDACYSTQPVELLNSCNSVNSSLQYTTSKKLSGLSEAFQADHLQGGELFEEEISDGDGFDSYDNGYLYNETPKSVTNEDNGKINAEANYDWDVERQELSSHSESEEESKSTSGGFFRNQTFGKKLMGNMMDTFLLKNLTFKGRGQPSYKPASSSPEQVADLGDQAMVAREQESLLPETVRSKCVAQLLFLNALDSVQRKHWVRLQPSHKIVIMDILLSMVDFAASYNSYQNLRIRMQQVSDDRPPINLLRQEIEGSRIYLTILQKTIAEEKSVNHDICGNSSIVDMRTDNGSFEKVVRLEQEKLKEAAEHRLVSFCGHILKEAADLQPGIGNAVENGIYNALALRSPVVMKVLRGLSKVENKAFKKIFPELYPYFRKLICCEQVEVRRALGDLFKAQFLSLLC